MKSFIIFVLLLALGAAAYFTRPSQDDFKRFVVQQKTKNDHGFFTKAIDQTVAQQFADSCTYRDRFLWTDVQRDGKTVFSGAFAHWFSHAAVKEQIHNLDQKVTDKVKELDQKLTKA